MNKWFAGMMAVLSVSAANAADYPVTIDSCGTPVTFTQAPKRAVIHDLNMSEMAFALGLQDRIVGLTGITGWYKMTRNLKRRWVQFPSLRLNIPLWKRCWRLIPTSFSRAGITG